MNTLDPAIPVSVATGAELIANHGWTPAKLSKFMRDRQTYEDIALRIHLARKEQRK